jgi:dolichol kinase
MLSALFYKIKVMLLHVCFTNLEPDPFVMVIVFSLGQADTVQTLAGTTVGSKSNSCWHSLGADEEIPHIFLLISNVLYIKNP